MPYRPDQTAERSAAACLGWARRHAKLDVDLSPHLAKWIDRTAGPDACWPWTGKRQTVSRYGGGYGVLWYRMRNRYVHRLVLEIALGRPLNPGEEAAHRCDNPPCIRPAHLFVATHAENMADMAAKGRQYRPSIKTHCKRGHVRQPRSGPTPLGRLHCPECTNAGKRARRLMRPDPRRAVNNNAAIPVTDAASRSYAAPVTGLTAPLAHRG